MRDAMESPVCTRLPSSNQAGDADDLLNDALARVARLEAVLATTGGTLHDVNNLLTVLSGNLYLLTEAVRTDAALLVRCRSARNTAQQAGTLIRELLSFARDTQNVSSIICPARRVQGMEALLRRGINNSHQLQIQCESTPWFVAASAAQFESAVANLVLNANEAMTRPGWIELRVRNSSAMQRDESASDVPPGDCVRIDVVDNGPGIPADMLPKVIQPLYTSKPRHQGNGMGLAMVRGFAERAGGCFTIESVEGKGTTATVWLPREAHQGDITSNLSVPIAKLPSGSETILLVAADQGARVTIAQLLDALGYKVLQCGDRRKGLRLALEHSNVSLVICERTKSALAEETEWLGKVCKQHPSIRHLALIDHDADVQSVAKDASAFVRQPIGVPELAESIRSALERS